MFFIFMQKIYFVNGISNNPYFNLASEEYLLKQTDGYYFYLWINSPAVIVGVNQNTLQEVNLAYTEANDIKVVRRLTGGGAVYHDTGNICYTVISPFNPEENAYIRFTSPIIEYLNTLGVKAEFSGRNDITVDGKKISGNAQTIYNGKIMHHGTILFDTDATPLTNSLIQNKLKIESKGIKSIRARVTNIRPLLKNDMTTEEFYDGLSTFFSANLERYIFTEKDITAIHKSVKEKYSTYEWNIGYSPKGKNVFEGRFDFGTLKLNFDLTDGLIENAELYGDFFTVKDIKAIARGLNGVRYERSAVFTALKDIGEYIKGASAEEIAKKIFD